MKDHQGMTWWMEKIDQKQEWRLYGTEMHAFGQQETLKITAGWKEEPVTEIGFEAVTGGKCLSRIVLPETIRRLHGCPYSEYWYECGVLARSRKAKPKLVIDEAHPHLQMLEDGTVMDKAGTVLMWHADEDAETYVVPEGVTEIGDYAFYHHEKLRKIVLPKSLRRIGAYAFSVCVNLCTVHLPEGLEEIGEGTFERCCGLTQIRVPDSVTKIGEKAFAWSKELKTIEITPEQTKWASDFLRDCYADTVLIRR